VLHRVVQPSLRWCGPAAITLAVAVAALSWKPTAPHTPDASAEHTTTLHVKVFGVGPATLSAAGALDIQPLFMRPAAARHLELAAWWKVTVAADQADTITAELLADPLVVSAFVPPQPQLPVITSGLSDGDSCPIDTPLYEKQQGYLGPAPKGVDAPAAWAVSGGKGDGVWVADVEGAWNADHEDIPGERIVHVGGKPMLSWRPHGTAVLGELVAKPNELGMVGITPNVERIVTASIGKIGAAAAIDLAAAALRPGDVLLIELHAIGPRGRFMPMEYWDDVFDVVKAATDRGVIVVAAAGNGGENLDHKRYKGKLDRTVRDSGAILVGAGAPAHPDYTDRSRLYFSNYGSRVDVQGWGFEVATFDYGDLQGCDADDRKYTAKFGGTSSASPIVTGAAIALQGIARQRDRVITPLEMRELLRSTGSPQTSGPDGGTDQHIGPRPNLAEAIDALD
jgi:subtilisin family serine protease